MACLRTSCAICVLLLFVLLASRFSDKRRPYFVSMSSKFGFDLIPTRFWNYRLSTHRLKHSSEISGLSCC